MTFTGYVYKITGACGLIYIGSTRNYNERKNYHKRNKNNSSTSRLLKKPLQFDIIDTREYKLMKTLHLIEQFYLDNNNTINQKRAYTNKKKRRTLYRSLNREKIRYQERLRRENNKEKIKQQKKVKIICECGCLVIKDSIARHKRTKKHLKLMNLL